jgi:hypothetical protein
MVLRKPLPIILENGPDKVSGFVMKLTLSGLMVEIEKIPFKVGTFHTAHFALNEKTNLTERVRSIKHYDKFYRRPPTKKPKEGQPPPVPKMLCELHFSDLSSDAKIAISKFLILEKTKATAK